MTKKTQQNSRQPTLTIPSEDAVFWMDGRGRWHNRHGPFEHQRIIEHFNTSIQKDADGYFVAQERDGFIEKVYFNYEDTALFVIEIIATDPITLLLNTRVRLVVQPAAMLIKDDHLYVRNADDLIKFNEHALLEISQIMEYHEGKVYIRIGQQRQCIHEG